MTSKHIGIKEARPILGDLVTAAQQGTEIILTRNGRPVARIVAHQEDPMVTIAELAAAVGMSTAPDKVARFAGCFTQHDPRTGRLPLPGQGQGMAATFTRDQADQLIAEWHRAARAAEEGRIEPIVEAGAGLDLAAANRRHDEAVAEVRERFRP